ncbi:hypothetical protein EJ07DRAFT_156215 [Lizonia empirigonia]|nr:hypothetical protein EJ07DRAFT_156215 [Lizonia empirigonia]
MTAFTELPAGESVNICNGLPKQHVQNGSSSNGSAPLQISRLTSQESTPFYYPQNSFSISFPTHRPGRATDLPPIADYDSAFCRQLTIHTNITHPNSARTKEAAHRIGTLTNIITPFEILNLKFSSKASKFLQSRVDDAILHTAHPITDALRMILTFGVAELVRVELDNVWFATDVADDLQRKFGGRLDIFTTPEGGETKRQLTGQYSTTHLDKFGSELRDGQDAEYLQEEDSASSSLGSALSDLDMFCPMDFLDEDPQDFRDRARFTREDSGFFDMDGEEVGWGYNTVGAGDLHDCTSDAEELDENDDVDDEELEDIPDIDSVVGNLEEMEMQRVDEKDVCYMTNFAPELLGRWV